jgi:glucokinase
MSNLILAGDIGGTNCRLSLAEVRGTEIQPVRTEVYPSAPAKGLEEIAVRFLASGPKVEIAAAALAIAGPVIDGRCVTTNLPWVVTEASMSEALRCPRVRLLNDLQSLAYGVLFVPDQLKPLTANLPSGRGHAAVIAAGTGLGEAYLWWDGERYHPIASEGSHGELGPRNDVELQLCRYLIQRFGHPSVERVVSGPGFSVLYDFLRDTGIEQEPSWLKDQIEVGDRNANISRLGLEGKVAICTRAMDLFVDIYGSEAGNMALRLVATGGVYIGGGIAPKILPRLLDGRFQAAFCDKGRYRKFCSDIPLAVVQGEKTGLLGATQFARSLLS